MRDTRVLPCTLTEAELSNRRDKLAATVGQIVEVEAEKADVAKEFTSRLKELGGICKETAKQIRERAEHRSVEIEHVHDVVRFCVDTFRLDTHELIGTRRMTDDEVKAAKQLSLPSMRA